ncbi:hypothetical protein EV121DRAFT_255746 [Schizophyllum commune]
MPALDVIDISDGEDGEITFSQASLPPSSQLSAGEVIDLSDSDTEPDDAFVPAPSSPAPSNQPQMIELGSSSEDNSSGDEFPELGSQQFAARAPSRSNRGSHTPLETRDSGSSAGSKRTRAYSDDSEDESEPPTPVKKPRRSRKTAEDKAKEEGEKEAKRLEREAKKQEKETQRLEKEAAKVAREEERARKKEEEAAQKTAQRSFKAANKLVNDRKETLAETTIVVSASLARAYSSIITDLRTKVGEYGGTVEAEADPMPGHDTIRFRRRVTKKFDTKKSVWQHCEPKDKFDQTAVLWLSAQKLAEHGARGTLGGLIDTFCTRLALEGPKRQAILLIHGMAKLQSQARGAADRALLALEMAHDAFHMCAETPAEIVQRLYDTACDVGHRIHKYLERSHLPFCAETRQPKGKGAAETWEGALASLYRMNAEHAKAIAKVYPTMDSLYRAYEGDPQAGPLLLAHIPVECTANGQKRVRDKLGPALSKRVFTVLYDTDPLRLVVNDK